MLVWSGVSAESMKSSINWLEEAVEVERDVRDGFDGGVLLGGGTGCWACR